MADGDINVKNTDIKSPRDLALHLQARSAVPATKGKVEDMRNDSHNYDGSSPAEPDGKWSEVGDADFLGSVNRFKP